MKKTCFGLILALALMLCPLLAFAEESLLLVSLPEDARMVENIEFDDGDFNQTYQLNGDINVQLLRYAFFDMSAEELAQSEWTGCAEMQTLDIGNIDGCETEALRFSYEENGQTLVVTTIIVHANGQTLMFEAVCPEEAAALSVIEQMIETLSVMGAAEYVG